jgi:hypothetical protein
MALVATGIALGTLGVASNVAVRKVSPNVLER